MILNCFDATRLLSEAMERPLTFKERIALNMHTMMCAGCRNFGQQMHSMRLFAKAYAHQPDEEQTQPGTPS